MNVLNVLAGIFSRSPDGYLGHLYYRTDGRHRYSLLELSFLSFSSFVLHFAGGGNILLIRLIVSLTGQEAVNGYKVT